MRLRSLAVSAAVCALLVALGMWIFDLSIESALVLAPVFVLSVGGVAFLVILWTKVIYDSVRRPSAPAADESRRNGGG